MQKFSMYIRNKIRRLYIYTCNENTFKVWGNMKYDICNMLKDEFTGNPRWDQNVNEEICLNRN